jgi:rhodanese-related sulfurtransferase
MPTQHQRKERSYRLFTRISAAMANPHRLELLDLLVQAPRTVEELAREASLSVANASQHLQRLKQARLVIAGREGLYQRYRLADPAVMRLWLELRAVGEKQLDEVDQALNAYRTRRHKFEKVTIDELRDRLRAGKAVLIDAQPGVEYQAGHLPQALPIPLDELERRLDELPRNRTLIVYCRGPLCVIADDALAVLSKQGRRVARLEEGVAEWQQAGLAIER